MQMSAKKTDSLIKESRMLMTFMSGEEKMHYLERMWDLYFEVYIYKKPRYSINGRRQKYSPMKGEKAYELLTGLVKIFGH